MSDSDSLAEALVAGDRRALARAITVVESTRPEHRRQAERLLQRLAPQDGESLRVGISGAPGVGKSTFIEALGQHVIEAGHAVAVLAIDPSSVVSGGSILGDKTRMTGLARHARAFIRPTPAGSAHGGVAARTREAIVLCEAAGFDVVFVETLGVGQSDTAAADVTDAFVLLLAPGGGDELQGIKRGNLELADLVLVNKADGELVEAAGRTAAEYGNALRLLRPRFAGWTVPVRTCSALNGDGVAQAWSTLERYRDALQASSELQRRRSEQARAWMWSEVTASLLDKLRTDAELGRQIEELERDVASGALPASVAASRVVDAFSRRKAWSDG